MSTKNLKIFVVIPTIRNLDFLKFWGNQFADCHLIVVEDNSQKTLKIGKLKFKSITHLAHDDIKKDFGEGSWIFSRKNAGIRSFGFWKAYKMGADIIITIDDDCYPTDTKFIEKHFDNLNFPFPDKWITTYPDPKWIYTRGIPYSIRGKGKVFLSHGLWSGALDLDAKTEIKLPKLLAEKQYPPLRQIIPFGYFYPMCSMNLSFRREIAVLMFFPMMGLQENSKPWPYDRFDDIWAGIFSKKIMDHLNMGVINGSPFINHKKASKPLKNLKKEENGMKINEKLWKLVDNVKLTSKTPKDCYIELARKIDFPKNAYFTKLRQAMIIWANKY